MVLSQTARRGATFIFTDQLQTPLFSSDESGRVLEEYLYDEFGYSESISSLHPLAFAGYLSDTSTGLLISPTRFYDPRLGRFCSKDVKKGYLGNPASQNEYTYCLNRPLFLVDKDGREPSSIANQESGVDTRNPIDQFVDGWNGFWEGLSGTNVELETPILNENAETRLYRHRGGELYVEEFNVAGEHTGSTFNTPSVPLPFTDTTFSLSLSVGFGEGCMGINNVSQMMNFSSGQVETSFGVGYDDTGVRALASSTGKTFLNGAYDAVSITAGSDRLSWETVALVVEVVVIVALIAVIILDDFVGFVFDDPALAALIARLLQQASRLLPQATGAIAVMPPAHVLATKCPRA